MPGTTPVVSDILELNIVTAHTNQIALQALHYRVMTVAGTGRTLQAMASSIDALLHINFKNIIANPVTYRGVSLTNLTAPRSQPAISTANAGVGTGGASLAPTQVRGLISWYSNLAGRRYRGRTYLPFPPTTAITVDGDPTAGYVTLMDTVRTILQGPLTFTSGADSTTLALSIYHRKDIPPTASDVVSGVTRNRFATQRRSGAYGRANTPPF